MTRWWPKPVPAAALPAGLAALGATELALLQPRGWGTGVLLEVAACVFLLWRRSNPLLFATLPAAVLLVMPWAGPQLNEPAVPIMIWAVSVFALGRWLPGLRGLAGVAVIVTLVFAGYALLDPRHHTWSDVMFVAALIIPPYVLARITGRLAGQKELLERQQGLIRRQAVRDERDRIAREMHDVIAHSVSAMVVQTAAAQDLVRCDPAHAERVLADVADSGRRALAETGRLLHVLRDDRNELRLEPSPRAGEPVRARRGVPGRRPARRPRRPGPAPAATRGDLREPPGGVVDGKSVEGALDGLGGWLVREGEHLLDDLLDRAILVRARGLDPQVERFEEGPLGGCDIRQPAQEVDHCAEERVRARPCAGQDQAADELRVPEG